MLVQMNGVNFAVSSLESSACQKTFADALNSLDAMLITKVIELLEDFVYLLYKLFGLVCGDHLVKVFNYDIND
jgi:hypothetical protein